MGSRTETEKAKSKPTPTWLWVVLLLSFSLVFYSFGPKAHVDMPYDPWFLQQVEDGNVARLEVDGVGAVGELYDAVDVPPKTAGGRWRLVRKFAAEFPGEDEVATVVDRLRDEGVDVEIRPADPSRGEIPIMLAMLFVPTLVLAYLFKADPA